MSQKESKKRKLTTLVVFAVVLVVVLTACFFMLSKKDPNAEHYAPAIIYDESVAPLEFETPYCVMHYPSHWKDYIQVEEITEKDVLAEIFTCEISGNEYPLFTIYFGESAEGDRFGYITLEGEKIPVSVVCAPFSGDAKLTKEDETNLYAMMEGVNDVLQSIASAEGYTAE